MPQTAHACFADLLRSWAGDRPVAEVARVLGVAWGTVDGWRRGTSLPPRTRLPGLAVILSIPIQELTAVVGTDRARRRAGIPIDTPAQTAAVLAERGHPVPQET